MNIARFVIAGFCLAGLAAALWWLGRPLRSRPRPSPDVSAARFQRLSPIVMVVIIALVSLLIVGLAVSALFG